MTIEQAIEVLNQATAQLNAPRPVHEQILRALEVIRTATKAQETK